MKISSLLIVGSLFASAQVLAHTDSTNVIYGDDNRKDVFEASAQYVELSHATAAMIAPTNLRAVGNQVEVVAATLQSRGVCAKERFSQQISAANCSGFLVDGNKLVTAGHCITNQMDCNNSKWVFDFKVDSSNQGKVTVPATSVYSCKKIIARKLDNSSMDDFAFIELDRVVADRHPVKFRKSGKIAKGDSLVVIGHPTGLPTKIADGASVRSLSGKFFTANLDTYGGNSGSAVFNTQTGEVEGILVRGENDYVPDASGTCQVSNKCPADGCRGEDVTYITNVPGLMEL